MGLMSTSYTNQKQTLGGLRGLTVANVPGQGTVQRQLDEMRSVFLGKKGLFAYLRKASA